ncbi:MAG: glycosyltransferase [Eubacteriales bacterium]|jgi:glycosyltransferase involved in cell wall biosynthesis
MKKMKEILEVNVDDRGCGGVFSLVRSVILNKPEGYHMDIACIMPFSEEKHVKELNDAGCQIYFIGIEGQHHVSMKDLEKNLYALLERHHYEYVHVHSDTAYRMAAFGRAAKRAGVPHIIFHSHATDVDGNYRRVKKILHLRYRGQLKKLGTRFVACSRLAAQWMYPEIPEDQVTIVNNGVDLKRFRFDPEVRKEERNRLGLSDALVVGTVGRFSYQKNQEYMIDILSLLVKRRPDAKLLIVGSHDGTDDIWNMVREKTAAAGLDDRVIFYGTSPHVERLMQAMDVLILPSRFEGLPVVGVEAQAAGLPCIFSDRITRETKLTDNAEFIGIGPEDAGKWAEEICRMAELPRMDTYERLKEERFDLSDTIEAFLNLYV